MGDGTGAVPLRISSVKVLSNRVVGKAARPFEAKMSVTMRKCRREMVVSLLPANGMGSIRKSTTSSKSNRLWGYPTMSL